MKEQTKQCLTNIKAILESIDVPVDDVVKLTIYLTDLSDTEAVNEVYTTFFPDSAIARAVGYVPARTIVEASALPMGASVQVEAVVSHGDGTPPQAVEDRHGIAIWATNTTDAPTSPFSTQSVAFSHYNHLSGQLPLNPTSGQLVAGGVKEQTEQCLTNIKTIVESIDHVLEDVVKVNIFVTRIEDMETIDGVYKTFFQDGIPARRIVGVSALPHDANVQIEAVVGNAEGTPPKL